MDWYVLIPYPFFFSLQELEVMLTYIVVIVLIAAEILVAAINIVVDLYAGVD